MLKFILIIAFSPIISYGQQIPEDVSKINDYWQETSQRLKDLRRVTEQTFELSTDGGEIIRHYDGDRLVNLSFQLNGETGLLNRNYCLKDGQLVYVFDEEFRYNVPYYIDSLEAQNMGLDEWFDPEKTRLFNNEYYFSNGNLIWWIKDEEAISKNDPEFKEKERFYLKEFEEYK